MNQTLLRSEELEEETPAQHGRSLLILVKAKPCIEEFDALKIDIVLARDLGRQIVQRLSGLERQKLASSGRNVDFYILLSVSKDASLAEIKSAYHRVLLRSHPDKRNASHSVDHVDIALIKEAYTVLSNTTLRGAYDAQLKESSHTAGPRPAQIVSLEEFEEEAVEDDADDSEEGPWRYSCRCGGWYRISTALMEKGEHLIACSSCSEVIWVGYELVE